MNALIVALLLYPVCNPQYDPMNGTWVQVCRDSSETKQPECRSVYNPMTGKWEYVCTQPR